MRKKNIDFYRFRRQIFTVYGYLFDMKPLQLALQYMDILFNGNDVEALSRLLSPDEFHFKGPFYQFDSAEEYIQSLKSDPPEGFEYEIIATFESDTAACLVYRFSKPGVSVLMAQMFEVRYDKISKILLIFLSIIFLSVKSFVRFNRF